MNQKLKAISITAGLGLWCVAVAFGLQYLSKIVTPEQFVMALAVVGISACFYMIYSLILTKIQFDDQIKSLVDKK